MRTNRKRDSIAKFGGKDQAAYSLNQAGSVRTSPR